MYKQVINKIYDQISLNDVKYHLVYAIDDTSNDIYLSGLTQTALNIAENFIDNNIALTTTLLTDYHVSHSYRIFEQNITIISDITGTTANNQTIILKNNIDYFIKKHAGYSEIIFNDKNIIYHTISLIYVSGYNIIPSPIKAAILLKIGELEGVDRNNYITSTFKCTEAFENLLMPYKRLC